MRLLVDEDTQSQRQLEVLRTAGHDTLSVAEQGLNGIPDADVLALATHEDRVLLTHNCADFLELTEQGSDHPGVLAIYNDSDPAKNMTYMQVAQAVSALEQSGTPVAGKFHVLNQWRI